MTTKLHEASSKHLSHRILRSVCGKVLTIELLPKKSQEHSEVDGTLPLVQHLVQLFVFNVKFTW